MHIPTIEDVRSAAVQLNGKSFRTPLLQFAVLNEHTGANVFVKPECLQRTGSFKFRGAFNAISRLSEEEKAKGVVTSSSGNHAQGVSKAAQLFGVKATIVMPEDAPDIKVRRTRQNGANIVFYDRGSQDRTAVVMKVLEEVDGTFVHPYDNPHVIAGQGTVGLEILEDLENLDLKPDRVLVCTGGGGLTAGVALSVHSEFPDAHIHSVEPEGFDDYRRSLISGTQERNAVLAGSVCDAILTPFPGDIGFEINKAILSEGLVVRDADAIDAVKFAYEELKLVVEPGGAVALAALLKAEKAWQGETVVAVISGGNIDPQAFAEYVSQ
ncbi:MAG: threonine/serine dehydratase [Pseudomonadota bacterium]